jgi:hypothetical protein
MPEDRETRRQLLLAAVEGLLDHLDQDWGPGSDMECDFLGAVVISAEVHTVPDANGDSAALPAYWSSNENKIWTRGFFEILADYGRLQSPGID